MAGSDDTLGQDEIEELLRQAAAGAGRQQPPAPPAAPTVPTPAAEERTPAPRATGKTAGGNASVTVDADVQYLLKQAEEALRSIDDPNPSQLEGLAPYQLRQLTGAAPSRERASLELLRDVELDLRIELGRTHMHLEDVLQLRKGCVVPLDKLAGDPVDVYVNGRLVARGEVLVLNENFCVRIAELISGDELD